MKRKGRSVREAFEAWYRRYYTSMGYSDYTISESLQRDDNGHYCNWDASIAYIAFQAGRRSGGGGR